MVVFLSTFTTKDAHIWFFKSRYYYGAGTFFIGGMTQMVDRYRPYMPLSS